MNDRRLLAIKHGRIMLPLAGLILILAIVRINSDELAVLQAFAVGRMLIDFILVLYALDSIIQLAGLCADRLLLLSPMSRWRITLNNVCIVGLYLLIAHIIGMIPQFTYDNFELNSFWIDLSGYIAALISGLGLMVFVAFLMKGIRSKTSMHIFDWLLYIGFTIIWTYLFVGLFKTYNIDSLWIIGVSESILTCNIYAGLLPITLIDVAISSSVYFQFVLINLSVGTALWIVAWLLSKKRNNYLEVN